MKSGKQKIYQETQELLLFFQKELCFPLTKSAAIQIEKNPWIISFFHSSETSFSQLPPLEGSFKKKYNQKSEYRKSLRECHRVICKIYSMLKQHKARDNFPDWMKWDNKQSLITFFEIFFEHVFHFDSEVLTLAASVLPKGLSFYKQDFEHYKHIEQQSIFSKEDYQTLCDLHAMMKANARVLGKQKIKVKTYLKES